MIPPAILDALLVAVLSIWAALGVAIVIGRALHERRARRQASIWNRLRDPAQRQRAGEAYVHAAARAVTAAEFEEMTRAGLPPHLETAIAREICARAGGDRLRALADGTARADVWVRVRALQILVSAQQGGMYATLERCLRSGEREVAAAAVRLLIRLDERRAADILIHALRDGVHTRSRLAAALDRMSASRTDALPSLLQAPEPIVRFWGARLAARLADHRCAPRIRALTADPDPLVRRAAVEALGAIGTRKDLVLILTRFVDPAPVVRLHAARASAAFAGPEIADALTELLTDREYIVRAAARDALRRIGTVGTPALIRTLWGTDTFAANNAAEVLYSTGAAVALGRRVLDEPERPDLRGILARFLTAGGPHLERALLHHFDPADGGLLLLQAQSGAGMAGMRV